MDGLLFDSGTGDRVVGTLPVSRWLGTSQWHLEPAGVFLATPRSSLQCQDHPNHFGLQ